MDSVLSSLGFNANDVDPSVGFEPLPEGLYTCMVQKAEEKKTRDGKGVYLNLELIVIEGPKRERKLWHRINIQNPNEQCVKIGRGELSAFCRAVGLMTPKFAHEFANRTLRVGVKVEPRNDGKGLQNVVNKFESLGSSIAGLVQNGTSAPSQPSGSQPAPAPAGAAPWTKA